jgi:hypothetical protein
MIRVRRAKEPRGFDLECRRRGQAWLKAHPANPRPKPFWRENVGELAEAFEHRCGYSAIMIQSGTVDHFLSWKHQKQLVRVVELSLRGRTDQFEEASRR